MEQRLDHGLAVGNGVFLAPNKVLTAWHILAVMNNPIFKNEDGDVANKLAGSKTIRSVKKDLAIVTLDRNIGKSFCETIAENEASAIGIKGWLVSRYRSLTTIIPEINPVEFNTLTGSAYDANTPHHIVFNCASQNIGPGYSGAPVIARNGKVISLVSWGINPATEDSDDYRRLQAITSGLQGAKPFTGVTPVELARFIEAARAEP